MKIYADAARKTNLPQMAHVIRLWTGLIIIEAIAKLKSIEKLGLIIFGFLFSIFPASMMNESVIVNSTRQMKFNYIHRCHLWHCPWFSTSHAYSAQLFFFISAFRLMTNESCRIVSHTCILRTSQFWWEGRISVCTAIQSMVYRKFYWPQHTYTRTHIHLNTHKHKHGSYWHVFQQIIWLSILSLLVECNSNGISFGLLIALHRPNPPFISSNFPFAASAWK